MRRYQMPWAGNRRRLQLIWLACWLAGALLRPDAAPAAISPFCFAWLSDTHIGSLTGEEDLRATVRDINSLTGLSFVVLSGDVTEYGSREQLRLAKEILDQIRIPTHVVPGNHDTKWSESGATDFARLWGADRFSFEAGGIRFIGLHEGPVMRMGDGHWAPQDVTWLEESLKALPDPRQPLVLVTHYPLDDGIANWFVVSDLLKKYNLQAVLCGHVHRNGKAIYEGVPGATGRSNLRANAEIGGYTIVDVAADGKMQIAERPPGGPTGAPWHTIQLEPHDFAAATNRPPRPDFGVNLRYPNVRPVWTRKSGFSITAAPTIAKDLVIVGDASGTVRAWTWKSGAPRWEFKTGGPVVATAAAGGDLVVVPSTDGFLYSLEAATGRLVWKFESSRPIVAAPAVANKTVYVGSSEGKFFALDLASGKRLWQFEGLTGFVEARPLVTEGKVIFGAWDQNLYALDALTGRLKWKWMGDRPGALFSPAACWPAAAHGKVFVVAPDRKMTAINLKNGETLWRSGAAAVRESIGISEDGSRVYVRTMQDYINAYSASASSAKLAWSTNAGFGYDINSAMLVEKDGSVFYGTKNGLILALAARTGSMLWQHRVGVALLNTLAPLSATQVVATDVDGQVALIEQQRNP